MILFSKIPKDYFLSILRPSLLESRWVDSDSHICFVAFALWASLICLDASSASIDASGVAPPLDKSYPWLGQEAGFQSLNMFLLRRNASLGLCNNTLSKLLESSIKLSWVSIKLLFNLLSDILWCILPSSDAIVLFGASAWMFAYWVEPFSILLETFEVSMSIASGIWVKIMRVSIEVSHGLSLNVVSGCD